MTMIDFEEDESDDRLSAEIWNSDRELRDRIYGKLLDATEAGPFDGGCVLMAQALQKFLGGELVALIGANGRAQHAAVKVGEIYHDYNGSGPAREFIDHFNRVERPDTDHWIVTIGALRGGSLPGAPRSKEVASDIAALIEAYAMTAAAETEDRNPRRPSVG
jgi:hypothetical protein